VREPAQQKDIQSMGRLNTGQVTGGCRLPVDGGLTRTVKMTHVTLVAEDGTPLIQSRIRMQNRTRKSPEVLE
jgi:hypothetical protein